MLGGGRGMAGLCWLHYRLSLCKGDGGGLIHAGFTVG